MRSIPEKTLEHWTSIYLSNRFPNGALWWPASGEDVLTELPRLAASGSGKTLALELKTTEARGADHVLEIDTHQLNRYLNPSSGPQLPVYYVFPTPHWIGPLTSRSGTAPLAPRGSASAPPEWWRRRVGRALVRRLAPRHVRAIRGCRVAAPLERAASDERDAIHPE
jgi:hypothetical protein